MGLLGLCRRMVWVIVPLSTRGILGGYVNALTCVAKLSPLLFLVIVFLPGVFLVTDTTEANLALGNIAPSTIGLATLNPIAASLPNLLFEIGEYVLARFAHVG